MHPEPQGNSSKDHSDPFERLISAARQGSPQALGDLMQTCRRFLLKIANDELESDFNAKAGGSDLVQETLLSAQRRFDDFRGCSREELLAWLRMMLLNDIRDMRRHYRTAQRDVGRERPIGQRSRRVEELAAAEATPGTGVIARDDLARLAQAIERLSAQDREVVELRSWQALSFTEVGERTGRSAEAARKLWSRAIIRLQTQMEAIRD